MKVVLSSDIILCGWLGLKHQLTNSGMYNCVTEWTECRLPSIDFSVAVGHVICQESSCGVFHAVSLIYSQGGMLPYLAVSLLDMLAAESAATALHYVFVFIDPIYIIFGGFYYIDKVRSKGFIQNVLMNLFIDPLCIITDGLYYFAKWGVRIAFKIS